MTSKKRKKSKYFFELPGIDIEKVHHKYGIMFQTINLIEGIEPVDTTKLTELNTEKGTPDVISFLDESKQMRVCQISMIDFESRMEVNLLRYHCYWCRHPFNTRPIGCPIKYISSQAVKTYHSHISKDTYTIKQDVTKARREHLRDKRIKVRVGEYYETDGVFCSFNCCKAFISSHTHVRRYDKSTMLLMKLYNSMTGNDKMVKISPAPHWRTLEPYGGHLNIVRFRDGFKRVDYECHGTIKPLPRFAPMATLYEVKIKF
jgi:hypothetical protein